MRLEVRHNRVSTPRSQSLMIPGWHRDFESHTVIPISYDTPLNPPNSHDYPQRSYNSDGSVSTNSGRQRIRKFSFSDKVNAPTGQILLYICF